MGAVLEVPLQPAGVGVERQQAAGVEVVTRADAAVIVGRGIASPPIQSVESRIIGAGHPRRSTAVQIRVAWPAFAALFSGSWDGPEPPNLLASICVERGEEAAHRSEEHTSELQSPMYLVC